MDRQGDIARLLEEWAKNGSSPFTAEALGDLYMIAKDHGAARRWYRIAFRLAPQNHGLQDKVEDSVIRVIVDTSCRYASPHQRRKRLEALWLRYATRSFERRARVMPGEGHLHFELGRLYYVAGRIDPAISEFTECLRHDKQREQSYFYLARCLMKKRLFEEAMIHFARAEEGILSLSIREDIRDHKAKCLSELGRTDDAGELPGE
jgi:tetratricopeptide (TPR) repeat protein